MTVACAAGLEPATSPVLLPCSEVSHKRRILPGTAMRRRSLTVLLLLPAVALAACGSGYKTTKLTLVDNTSRATVVSNDVAPHGPSPGDSRTFSTSLVTPSGTPAGRLEGEGTTTSVRRTATGLEETRIGQLDFFLSNGTVVIGGAYVSRPGRNPTVRPIVRPIIGGTGQYANATGTLTQSPLPGGANRDALNIRTPNG